MSDSFTWERTVLIAISILIVLGNPFFMSAILTWERTAMMTMLMSWRWKLRTSIGKTTNRASTSPIAV